MDDNAGHRAKLHHLDTRLTEAQKVSKNSSLLLGFGLALTLASAGLAIYNTTVLQADLDSARQALSLVQEGVPAAEADGADGAVEAVSDGLKGAIADGAGQPEVVSESGAEPNAKPAADEAEEGASEAEVISKEEGQNTVGNVCLKKPNAIAYSACSDAEIGSLSGEFWTMWSSAKKRMKPEDLAALEKRISRQLERSVLLCGVPPKGEYSPAQISKALPCLRRVFRQRSEMLEGRLI